MNREIDAFFKSNECKALTGLRENDIKLAGTNALSSAFRKIRGAMSLGGDLTTLTTISQCEKFHKEALKSKAEAETAAGIRKEVEMKYLKQGLVAGTPEFEKAVNDEMGLVLAEVSGSPKANKEEGTRDEWDQLGVDIAEALRNLAIEANNPTTAHQIAESTLNKLIKVFQDTLHNNAITKGLIPISVEDTTPTLFSEYAKRA
jgi:hypothetical protein